MAEGQEDRSSDDLTEEPSQHRLEDFKQKGQVAQSREITAIVGLLAGGLVLWVYGNTFLNDLALYLRNVFGTKIDLIYRLGFASAARGLLKESLLVAGGALWPLLLVVAIAGSLSSFAQIGPIFSFEPLRPDINKINPLKGLQRYFTMKRFYDAIRLILKVVAVGFISYGLVKQAVLNSPSGLLREPGAIISAYGNVAIPIFMTLVFVLLAFAGFDFWLEKWEYTKNLKMTKQEAKQEHKEREGDPQVKARIRMIQREMSRKRMLEDVKKATMVVTNPTHIAVALMYEDGMAAPKVVAKGADFLAEKIKKIARESGIPCVEDRPLARALYKTVKIGQSIPRDLYEAVAKVLTIIFQANNEMS